MKKLLLSLSSAILCAIILYACQKQLGPGLPEAPQDKTVVAGLQGRITDPQGIPVQNAKITSGAETTYTDINGVFSFSDIALSERFGYVKVEKEGYFTGSRSIIANEETINFVEIELIERVLKAHFPAASGGLVTVESGQAVNFDPNSIVKEGTNIPYTQAVNVFATWIDPSSPQLSLRMPGDLRGINSQGQETAMKSYGMMTVELEGVNGEKLQLAKGKTAMLSMTIPSSLLATAPATIPLWYFDEATGKWMEEGVAIKQGNMYVGTVTHFTTWNADVPVLFIDLKAQFKNQYNNPIRSARVKIKNTNDNSWWTAYTDDLGNLSISVPKNVPLVLEVYNICSTELHTKNIGPFTQNADLGIIPITLQVSGIVTITGTVQDCDGQPLQNGSVIVSLEGIKYREAVENGTFSIRIDRCNANTAIASIIAFDRDNDQQSPVKELTVTTGTTDVGMLQACGVSSLIHFNFTLGEESYQLDLSDSLDCLANSGQSILTIGSPYGLTEIGMQLKIAGSAPGIFDMTINSMWVKGTSHSSPIPIACQIKEFGSVGEFVSGTFSGTVVNDTTKLPSAFSGNFRVPRIQ